jgi:hypothetical protein
MNPFLSKELAGEHIRDLREAARGGRVRAEDKPQSRDPFDRLSVRPFAERDIDAIRLLAALDSKQMPTGAVLVAEQAGEVVAALALDGGRVLADPFKPTADIVALLKLRARQLQREKSAGTIAWTRFHMPRGRLAA